MDLTTILRICRSYNDLGWAVQEQLGQLVDENALDGLNPNAIHRIENFLHGMQPSTDGVLHDQIDDLLEIIERTE